MKRCYIAGPMSGIADFNFPAFDEAKRELTALGWDVISPADMDRADGFDERGCTGGEMLTSTQRQGFARNDIAALLEVDAVFLLPGWETSKGATNEANVASWLGIDLYDYGTHSLIDPTDEWSKKVSPRASMLREAERLVDGDRNAQYGDPRQDFQRTATMWTAYLGTEVASHDVAALMAMLKLSRIRWSPAKRDSWVDLAGYAACGWHCAMPEEETT